MGTVLDDRVVDAVLMGTETGDPSLEPLVAFLADVRALAVAPPSDVAARQISRAAAVAVVAAKRLEEPEPSTGLDPSERRVLPILLVLAAAVMVALALLVGSGVKRGTIEINRPFGGPSEPAPSSSTTPAPTTTVPPTTTPAPAPETTLPDASDPAVPAPNAPGSQAPSPGDGPSPAPAPVPAPAPTTAAPAPSGGGGSQGGGQGQGGGKGGGGQSGGQGNGQGGGKK